MALSAFDDKSQPPRPARLRNVLGPSAGLWDRLIAFVAKRQAPLTESWGFPGVKYGWSLRLKKKDRTLVYLTPCEGHFLAGIVLGDKALGLARAGGLVPAPVLALVETAPKYAEGRGVRVEVRNAADLETAEHLVSIKMST